LPPEIILQYGRTGRGGKKREKPRRSPSRRYCPGNASPPILPPTKKEKEAFVRRKRGKMVNFRQAQKKKRKKITRERKASTILAAVITMQERGQPFVYQLDAAGEKKRGGRCTVDCNAAAKGEKKGFCDHAGREKRDTVNSAPSRRASVEGGKKEADRAIHSRKPTSSEKKKRGGTPSLCFFFSR